MMVIDSQASFCKSLANRYSDVLYIGTERSGEKQDDCFQVDSER